MPKSLKKPVRTTCPNCGAKQGQIRNGKNPSGSRRFYCKNCGRHYTYSPRRIGYSKEKIDRVLHDYAIVRIAQLAMRDGKVPKTLPYPAREDRLFREIGRRRNIHHQTVKKWILGWYESGKSFDSYINRPKDS